MSLAGRNLHVSISHTGLSYKHRLLCRNTFKTEQCVSVTTWWPTSPGNKNCHLRAPAVSLRVPLNYATVYHLHSEIRHWHWHCLTAA